MPERYATSAPATCWPRRTAPPADPVGLEYTIVVVTCEYSWVSGGDLVLVGEAVSLYSLSIAGHWAALRTTAAEPHLRGRGRARL